MRWGELCHCARSEAWCDWWGPVSDPLGGELVPVNLGEVARHHQ